MFTMPSLPCGVTCSNLFHFSTSWGQNSGHCAILVLFIVTVNRKTYCYVLMPNVSVMTFKKPGCNLSTAWCFSTKRLTPSNDKLVRPQVTPRHMLIKSSETNSQRKGGRRLMQAFGYFLVIVLPNPSQARPCLLRRLRIELQRSVSITGSKRHQLFLSTRKE